MSPEEETDPVKTDPRKDEEQGGENLSDTPAEETHGEPGEEKEKDE